MKVLISWAGCPGGGESGVKEEVDGGESGVKEEREEEGKCLMGG